MDESLSLDVLLFKVGITPQLFKKTIPTNPATYQLSLSRFFRVHKDSPWMKELLLRISEENSPEQSISEGGFMDMFPGPSLTCTRGFKHRNQQCSTLTQEL